MFTPNGQIGHDCNVRLGSHDRGIRLSDAADTLKGALIEVSRVLNAGVILSLFPDVSTADGIIII